MPRTTKHGGRILKGLFIALLSANAYAGEARGTLAVSVQVLPSFEQSLLAATVSLQSTSGEQLVLLEAQMPLVVAGDADALARLAGARGAEGTLIVTLEH